VVIQTELSSGLYNFVTPAYELRCSVQTLPIVRGLGNKKPPLPPRLHALMEGGGGLKDCSNH
jgi:hypothetical protein